MKYKKIKYFLFLGLLTYAAVELTCFIFIKSGYIKAKHPSYHYEFTVTKYFYHVADINPVWGTWHYPDDYELKDECYKTLYTINSYGARDIERSRKTADTNRLVILGDSFMEGFGLDTSERLSNLLQKKTGYESLNFGCSNTGSTQEYLVYKNLADSFTHSAILLGFHPHTDFFDDDVAYYNTWPFSGFIFYRPFFVGNYPDYKLEYRPSAIDSSTFNKKGYFELANSFKGRVGRFLRAYTWWFNIIDYWRFNKVGSERYGKNYTGFNDYTLPQFQRLTYILTQLKKIAAGKRIIVCTIPIESDVTTYLAGGKNKLGKELSEFCQKNNIEFVDLLPVFAKANDKNLYFTCDPHWNEKGNLLAADTLMKLFK
ncbi:MAG: hypothetical protein EKK37_16860 [Sphingobacteriales bacterium]|nr:MAG: hypothetical protein EKK37_16860 [Sphingobacteriales bacterium]